jgi:hypothetical protein
MGSFALEQLSGQSVASCPRLLRRPMSGRVGVTQPRPDAPGAQEGVQSPWWGRVFGRWMGPQDPKDVTRDTARDLSALVGELAAADAIIG